MPYGNLLKKIAKEKKLTYIQISNKCKEMGIEVSTKYLTQIVNNIKPPPSVEKTKAIAKVLDIDERLLIIEGYIDKAPEVIKQIFDNIKKYSSIFGLSRLENEISKEAYIILKDEVIRTPIAEYLIDFLENDELDYINNKNFSFSREGITFSINANNLEVYKVTDNSMAPKLEENDNVTLEVRDKYIDGDIVAIKIKGYKEIVYGRVLFKNNMIMIMKDNNKFKSITYNKEDIQILGKVAKVIKEI